MNKSMRILLLATALSGAASGMAFADDTSAQSGTLNFNGLLTEGSCVLSGNTINHNFGTLSKAQQPVIPGTLFKAYKIYDDKIYVSNCPEEVTKVLMTATFTKGVYNNVVSNTAAGTTKSNAVMLIGKESGLGDFLYNTGVPVTFPVDPVKREVTIPVVSQVAQNNTTAMTSGDAAFDVTLAFDYQ